MRYSVHRVKCKSHVLLYKIVFKTSILARYKCYQNAFLALGHKLVHRLVQRSYFQLLHKILQLLYYTYVFLKTKMLHGKRNPFTCEK